MMDQAEQKNGEWQTYYDCANSFERRKKKHRPQTGHVNDDGRRYWLTLNGDENGTRPLERELLILGRQAPLVVKPYKKGHILTVPISQCPKDEFDAASLKRAVDGNGPF